MAIDAVRNDPEWNGGDYAQQPQSLRTVAQMLWLASSNPRLRQQQASTIADADRVLDEYVASYVKTVDANDILFALEASRDYDPGPRHAHAGGPVEAPPRGTPARVGIVSATRRT